MKEKDQDRSIFKEILGIFFTIFALHYRGYAYNLQ